MNTNTARVLDICERYGYDNNADGLLSDVRLADLFELVMLINPSDRQYYSAFCKTLNQECQHHNEAVAALEQEIIKREVAV